MGAGLPDEAPVLGNATVVLIDDPTLARLMVEHNLGATTEQTLTVKRFDSDSFSERVAGSGWRVRLSMNDHLRLASATSQGSW